MYKEYKYLQDKNTILVSNEFGHLKELEYQFNFAKIFEYENAMEEVNNILNKLNQERKLLKIYITDLENKIERNKKSQKVCLNGLLGYMISPLILYICLFLVGGIRDVNTIFGTFDWAFFNTCFYSVTLYPFIMLICIKLKKSIKKDYQEYWTELEEDYQKNDIITEQESFLKNSLTKYQEKLTTIQNDKRLTYDSFINTSSKIKSVEYDYLLAEEIKQLELIKEDNLKRVKKLK